MEGKTELKKLNSDSIDSQVELYSACFGARMSETVWRRKHYTNPLDDGLGMFGAYLGDRLVGMAAYLPMRFSLSDETFLIAQNCDVCVHKDARGRGIYSELLSFSENELLKNGYDALIGYPNNQSYKSLCSCGWVSPRSYHKLYLPCNVSAILRQRFSRRLPGCLNFIGSAFGPKVNRHAKMGRDLELESKMVIPSGWYERARDKKYLSFDCDEEMLNWKMQGEFIFFSVRQNGSELASFLIKYYRHESGLQNANIVVQRYETDDEKVQLMALARVLKELKRDSRTMIICVWDSRDVAKTKQCRKLGFLNNIVYKEGNPFMVKVISNDDKKREVLERMELWNPCMIEMDTMIDNHI